VLPDCVQQDVQQALAEDIGSGDQTALLLPENLTLQAQVICREPAVLCGRAWFDEVFAQIDAEIRVTWNFDDGDFLAENSTVCSLSGNARNLLTGERTALNFLQTLSGTSTLAWHYADAVKHTAVRILDTRKTVPGLRKAQKYAVTCGGCHNHRMGLYDAILIKENHIAAAGSIASALNKAASSAAPGTMVEIEVESLDQLNEAIANGANRILLDNFTPGDILTAVRLNKRRALLEASGGITLENIAEFANTGVDFISIGDLTKNVYAIDFSFRITNQD